VAIASAACRLQRGKYLHQLVHAGDLQWAKHCPPGGHHREIQAAGLATRLCPRQRRHTDTGEEGDGGRVDHYPSSVAVANVVQCPLQNLDVGDVDLPTHMQDDRVVELFSLNI
jgi:hypothetical protein